MAPPSASTVANASRPNNPLGGHQPLRSELPKDHIDVVGQGVRDHVACFDTLGTQRVHDLVRTAR